MSTPLFHAQAGRHRTTPPALRLRRLRKRARATARVQTGKTHGSRAGRSWYRLSTCAGTAQASWDISPTYLSRLLANPDELWQRHVARPVKLSHRSLIVAASLELGNRTEQVAYKRTRAKSGWKWLLAGFRTSGARRNWNLARALAARGIATPEPLFVCEPRGWGAPSYLATRWIAGSLNVHLYLWQLADRPAAERRRRVWQTAAALGRLLGRMHARGIANRDLNARNLLVVEQADSVEAYLVDLDGVRLRRRIGSRTRSSDLGRFSASIDMHPWVFRTDRLRFLQAYLAELPVGEERWKPFWRRIGQAANRVVRRLRRRGRPVS